jgi:hypothetical protein
MMHPTLVPSECKIMYGLYEHSTIGGNTPVACLFTTRHDTTRHDKTGLIWQAVAEWTACLDPR